MKFLWMQLLYSKICLDDFDRVMKYFAVCLVYAYGCQLLFDWQLYANNCQLNCCIWHQYCALIVQKLAKTVLLVDVIRKTSFYSDTPTGTYTFADSRKNMVYRYVCACKCDCSINRTYICSSIINPKYDTKLWFYDLFFPTTWKGIIKQFKNKILMVLCNAVNHIWSLQLQVNHFVQWFLKNLRSNNLISIRDSFRNKHEME
jgi:hypothetical protein